MKAARSASETQLRGKATSSLAPRKGKGILRAVTLARVASAVDKAQKGKDKDASKPVDVKSERVEREVKTQAPKTVKSERVPKKSETRRPGALPAGKKSPAALPAPKPAASTKPKSSKKTKRETTPGVKTVYKATPIVDLREGPNFGKVTSEIEKTFQPKKKKNA
jgi:hypothetical protein